MLKNGVDPTWRLILSLALLCSGTVAGAQTTPGGQVVAPGTRGQKTSTSTCNTDPSTAATATATTATDATCAETAPGFVAPALDAATPGQARNVVAFIRVDTIVPRPPVAMPEGDSFSVVGGATLVRVRRAELPDCLATGKRISARANASTSTTCLDRKGELLAYQECKTGSTDCVVVTPQDIAKQQASGKTP